MEDAYFFSALGVVWVFGFAVVLLIAWHLRNRRRIAKLNLIHEERMKAMEKGIPLPEFPDLGDEESVMIIGGGLGVGGDRAGNPRWPLGLGALLVLGGLGLMVAMIAVENELWPYGLVPVFLGIGMFLFYALTRTEVGKD